MDRAERQEIRALIASWSAAVAAEDARAVRACCLDEVPAFDLAPPLRKDAMAVASLEHWFAGWAGPIGHALRDVEIVAGDDVAYAFGLAHLSGRKLDGEAVGLWLRTTLGLRKVDGRWRLAHEHASVPFHMDGSRRAAVELTPAGTAPAPAPQRSTMSRISPCLWFASEAEDAAAFYTTIFPHSRITTVARYGEAGPGPVGNVMVVGFELDGAPFLALNGARDVPFTPAVSLVVNCGSQAEVDHFWDRLGEGGAPLACGWLTDRFGVAWQIVPARLVELVTSDDPAVAARAVAAMMEMRKIDIAALERAVAG